MLSRLICGMVLTGMVGSSASGAAAPVLLPACGSAAYKGSVEPASWSSGCTGGSANLVDLLWHDWGGGVAVANGTDRYNDCDPSCADGTIYEFPVELRVDRPRRCAAGGGPARIYTRFSIVTTYPEGNEVGQPPGRSEPSTFSTPCVTPSFRVAVGTKSARFGAFDASGRIGVSDPEQAFGKPDGVRERAFSCVKRWSSLGLTMVYAVFGSATDPCSNGTFIKARLTGRRWRTSSGIRPGVSATKAARHSVRRCRRSTCGTTGYALDLHRIECGPGRGPGVIAETARKRVTAFEVRWHSCE